MRVVLLVALACAASAQETGSLIRGWVIDELTGRPVAGAGVTLSGCERYWHAASGAGGGFEVENVPPCRLQINARKPGYVGEDYQRPPDILPVGSREVQIRLRPTGSLSGHVFDEENRPLGGINVYASPEGLGSMLHTVTGKDGSYEFSQLAPQRYSVEVRVPIALRKASSLAMKAAAGRVEVSPGVSLSGIDVTVRRVSLVRVSGRLTDPQTKLPAANAMVWLDPGDRTTVEEAGGCRATNTEGLFRFEDVEPGEYNLRSSRSKGCEGSGWALPLTVPRAGLSDLEFAVPRDGVITGKTRGPERFSMSDGALTLRLTPRNGGEALVLPVSAEGMAQESVPPGTYWIAVQRAGMPLTLSLGKPPLYVAALQCNGEPCPPGGVLVPEGGTVAMEIRLDSKVGSLTGKVTGDGPTQAATVFVLETSRPGALSFLQNASVAPDGSFSLAGLPPGDYSVVASPAGSRFPFAACRAKATRVTIKADAVANISVELCLP